MQQHENTRIAGPFKLRHVSEPLRPHPGPMTLVLGALVFKVGDLEHAEVEGSPVVTEKQRVAGRT